MTTKIAIVGQGDFINLAKRVTAKLAHRLNVHLQLLEINQADSPGLVPSILSLIEKIDTDIIITGRFIESLLRGKTSIPIIHLHLTPSDILIAVNQSIPYSRRIAIAMAELADLRYDFSALQDLLNIKLEYINYTTPAELHSKIRGFSDEEGTVIGTGLAVRYAQQFGMHGTLIYTEKSIIESIERALEIIHFKKEEEKRNQAFMAIINSVRDGIIATNSNDEITIVNDSARQLLQLPNENLLGTNLSAALSPLSLLELAHEESFQDKIIKFRHIRLNTTKTGIYQKNVKIGNVLTFQDMTHIENIEQKYRLENEAKGQIARSHFPDIISSNSAMSQTVERAKRFSQTDSTILIIGETGTGKELLAQSIHNHSDRKSQPFVAINCAALPETLLESQLFGYEDGAFTGASKNGKKGLFEIAHNGTVFLDEINSISLHFQARLLRVLQEKEVVRVGGNKVIPINIRVVAATNEDLLPLVKSSKFRADLYYRLNVLKLNIPPLRERLEDVPLLTKQFLLHQNKELYQHVEPCIEKLCAELKKYTYPGNIRELYNILERFSILCEPEKVQDFETCKQIIRECMEDRSADIGNHGQSLEIDLQESYRESLIAAERIIMTRYIDKYYGDKTKLASKLGMGRTTFYRKLKELGISY
ncbi:sigma 54-interacting transcriptional regulator [Brevibacillus choshinensis]|uniref:Sigma 54-interacting transcriptional regulator n=1 Tax=Brevibacillus choshinensis TaxID=54911 RepID=A0ABX7FG40_BRECH|nr:sigma 54-interacting transcriptional regulator [Brevibacillus choshinensis]QRG65149.1 sigma 54-interacting transcriptional regulator [Brevibacillus choshinensis]